MAFRLLLDCQPRLVSCLIHYNIDVHRQAFPACPVQGPIDPPVPFAHLGGRGAVPNKCGHCGSLFEGGCARANASLERWLDLDHGPCGVPGPTDPVLYEDVFVTAKVEVPRKCTTCIYLEFDRIRGFTCRKDREIWGDFPRSLDWGSWKPERIYIQLPYPKNTSKELIEFAFLNQLKDFIQEYRRWNPSHSIQEAKTDFLNLRNQLEEATKPDGAS
jgi:hypothetical protein